MGLMKRPVSDRHQAHEADVDDVFSALDSLSEVSQSSGGETLTHISSRACALHHRASLSQLSLSALSFSLEAVCRRGASVP